MFRLFSRGRRVRHVSSRPSSPVLQCGFARRTHETPSVQSSQSSSSYAGSGMNMSSGAGVLRSSDMFSALRLGDFNPAKILQNIMKGDQDRVALNLDIKPSFFIITIVGAIAISTIMTLVFSTRGVTQGYQLRDLETKSQALIRQNEVMTMELAQAQSLDAVVHNDVLLLMRPAKKVTYMSGTSAIASR